MQIFAFIVLTLIIEKIHTLASVSYIVLHDYICTPQRSSGCMKNKSPNALSF